MICQHVFLYLPGVYEKDKQRCKTAKMSGNRRDERSLFDLKNQELYCTINYTIDTTDIDSLGKKGIPEK